MPNSYLETIRTRRDDLYALQRKARVKAGESSDFLDEEEVLYLDLIYLINQAKEEGLEPSEAEELKTILAEVDRSRENLRGEVMTIIAGY